MEALKWLGIWVGLNLLYGAALCWVTERLGINLDVAVIGSLVFFGLFITLLITIILEERISKIFRKRRKDDENSSKSAVGWHLQSHKFVQLHLHYHRAVNASKHWSSDSRIRHRCGSFSSISLLAR